MNLQPYHKKTIKYLDSLKPKLTISSSQLGTWQSCRMKWYWIYVEDLLPVETDLPLMVGGITHTLRELWIQDIHNNEPDKRFNESVLDQLEDSIIEIYNCTPEIARMVSFEARRLIEVYLMKLAGDPDFTVHHPELHLEKDYGPYILYARLDGLAREVSTGYLYRDELKTAGKLDSAYLAGYRRGLQTGICHMLMQDLIEEKTHGTLFEILVKTKIAQAVRKPALLNHWQVEYARVTVEHEVQEIFEAHIYPSSKCQEYNKVCAYQPLCQASISPQGIDRVKELYTSRKEETKRKQNLNLFGVPLFEKDGLPKGG